MPMYTLDEIIKMMKPQDRRNKALIRDCIGGLGLYAAQKAYSNPGSPKIAEMRELAEQLVYYWGLDDGDNAKPVEDYLKAFDKEIDSAKAGAKVTDEKIKQMRTSVICGLFRYGEDLVVGHGIDMIDEIQSTSDLMKEIGAEWDFDSFVLDGMTAKLNSEIKTMRENIAAAGEQPKENNGITMS